MREKKRASVRAKFGKYVCLSKNSTTDKSGEKRASVRKKFGIRFFSDENSADKNSTEGGRPRGTPPWAIFSRTEASFPRPEAGGGTKFSRPEAGFSRFEVGYSRPQARCFLPRGQKGREGQEADSRPCTQHSISFFTRSINDILGQHSEPKQRDFRTRPNNHQGYSA